MLDITLNIFSKYWSIFRLLHSKKSKDVVLVPDFFQVLDNIGRNLELAKLSERFGCNLDTMASESCLVKINKRSYDQFSSRICNRNIWRLDIIMHYFLILKEFNKEKSCLVIIKSSSNFNFFCSISWSTDGNTCEIS